MGSYADGRVAAVDHAVGRGLTRLVGTYPSVGYGRHKDVGTRQWFADLLAWAGVRPHLRVSNQAVTARLHDGEGGRYLWVLNPSRVTQHVTVSLAADLEPVTGLTTHWGNHPPRLVDTHTIDLTLDSRDGHVVRLG